MVICLIKSKSLRWKNSHNIDSTEREREISAREGKRKLWNSSRIRTQRKKKKLFSSIIKKVSFKNPNFESDMKTA